MLHPATCSVRQDGSVRVLMEDEGGKLDLNFANTVLMQRLFTGIGYSRAEASKFADSIADYRDTDDARRLNGAVVEDYHRAGLSYGPANGPFMATEDLGHVLNIPRDLAARLQLMVTVYSGTPVVDLAFVPPELAAALAGGTALAAGNRHDSGVSGCNAYTIHSRARSASGFKVDMAATVAMTPGGTRPHVVYRWTPTAPVSMPESETGSTAPAC